MNKKTGTIIGVIALTAIAIAAVLAWPSGDGGVAQASCIGQPGRIVFSSNRDDGGGIADFEIYCMNNDGTDVRQLTENTSYTSDEGTEPTTEPIEDTQPSYSPDGKEIAFISNRPAPNPDGGSGDDGSTETSTSTDPEIYVMNSDGTNVRQVTNQASGPPSSNVEREPAWSPDGKQIAFRRGEGTAADLYIVTVATGEERKLMTGGSGQKAADSQPTWSPDGTKIAFRKGSGSSSDIYVYSLATNTKSQLAGANVASVAEANPNWSPDGTRIAFQRGDEGAGAGLYTVPATGGELTQITQPVANADGLMYADLDPAWSPDQAQMVFSSSRDGILGGGETESSEGSTEATGDTGSTGGDDPHGSDAVSGDIELFKVNLADPSTAIRLTDNGNDQADDPATPIDESRLGPLDISPDWQPIPQCADGADNDADGKTDYPDDPGCSSSADNDETDPPAGGGAAAAGSVVAAKLPTWRVTMRISDRTPARTQRVIFSGTVSPRFDGGVVRIQRRVSKGKYLTVGWVGLRKATKTRSKYSLRMLYMRTGFYRVYVPKNGSHRATTTPSTRVKVHR